MRRLAAMIVSEEERTMIEEDRRMIAGEASTQVQRTEQKFAQGFADLVEEVRKK